MTKQPSYKVKIYVTLKKSVLDPQGKVILQALQTLGFKDPTGLRTGKFFELWLRSSDAASAESSARAMCDRLLTNPVIEDYEVKLEEANGQ